MHRSAIHVGLRYVVDVAPRHPITQPKLCTVTAVDADKVTVRYPKLLADGAVRTVLVVVHPRQVLRDELEVAARAAAQQWWVRWWNDDYPQVGADAWDAYDRKVRSAA